MTDAFIQVPPDSTGSKLDMTELVVATETVNRQRVQLAGNEDVDLAEVSHDALTAYRPGIIAAPQLPDSPRSWLQTAISSSTTTTLIAAPGAGSRLRLWYFEIIQTGAASGTQTLRDGSSAYSIALFCSNTIVYRIAIPGGDPLPENQSLQFVSTSGIYPCYVLVATSTEQV